MAKSTSKGKQKQVEEPAASSGSFSKAPIADETAASTSSSDITKPSATKKPEKVKIRRIHVSGLPDITESEAKDRFKSFGEVTAVEGLGKLDANGRPLRYAFFDLKCTKSKLAQCMNLLSGSMWKGSTLRIAEAKPTFMERLEQERKQAAKQQQQQQQENEADPSSSQGEKKKKKRKRDSAAAVTAEGTLVDAENVKTKPGWKLDPKTHTPIFPIVMRPDHPLPPPIHVEEPVAGPSEPSSKDKSKKMTKKELEKAAKKQQKLDQQKKKEDKQKKKKKEKSPVEVSLSPPTRARMIKIDPTQWQPKHLREDDLENLPEVELEANTPAKKKQKKTNVETTGEIALPKSSKEVINTKSKPAAPEPVESSSDTSSNSSEDGEDEAEAGVSAPAAPFVTTKDSKKRPKEPLVVDYDEQAIAAERKANLDLVAKLLGGLPASLPPPEADITMQDDDDDDTSSDEDESIEDEEKEMQADGIPNGQIDISASRMPASEPAVPASSEETSETSDEASTSEGEEAPAEVDTAADEPRESDLIAVPALAQAASADVTSSSEDSEPDVEQVADASVVQQNGQAHDEPQPSHQSSQFEAVQMQSLTEMFKPQEAAAGFSLGDLLDDFEMDELETEVPVQHAPVAAERQSYQYQSAGTSRPAAAPYQYTQQQDTENATLFFPFPLEEDDLPGGILYELDPQAREKLLMRSWTGTSEIRRFKRTQTIDEITVQHDAIRRTIAEQVRKRHREAIKKQKRHGGKRGAQSITDEP